MNYLNLELLTDSQQITAQIVNKNYLGNLYSFHIFMAFNESFQEGEP